MITAASRRAVTRHDRRACPRSPRGPCSASSPRRCWYSAVTPSSLNRAATVPNTGRVSTVAAELLAVAGELAAHVAQRVLGAAPLELVDGDHVGEVEHVDLLELRRRAELGRHHVERHVDERARSRRRPGRCPASRRSRGRTRRPCTRRSCRRATSGTSAHGRAGGQRAEVHHLGVSIAFMRMRSPSSAPPPLRRVGSTARTAMRSLSSWSSRNRRISSSVSDDLPEPPVPVMPERRRRDDAPRPSRAARRASIGSSAPASIAVIARASTRWSPAYRSSSDAGGSAARSPIALADHEVDHAGRGPGAGRRPGQKMRATPYSLRARRSPRGRSRRRHRRRP